MRYMENKKGQGFDTFKLLIAAVVAMVILGIVTGVFQKVWAMIAGIQCVSSPINELTTKIQEAQSGIVTVTEAICLKNGQEFKADSIAGRLGSVDTITFECKDAAVCASGDPPQVDVDPSLISANADTSIKARIKCTAQSGYAGNFDCNIEVING